MTNLIEFKYLKVNVGKVIERDNINISEVRVRENIFVQHEYFDK